jgi:hypothetical protein
MHLEARTPVGQGGALLHGFVIAVIWEPRFRLGLVPVVSQGLAPLGSGMWRGCLDLGDRNCGLLDRDKRN